MYRQHFDAFNQVVESSGQRENCFTTTCEMLTLPSKKIEHCGRIMSNGT